VLSGMMSRNDNLVNVGSIDSHRHRRSVARTHIGCGQGKCDLITRAGRRRGNGFGERQICLGRARAWVITWTILEFEVVVTPVAEK